MPDCVFCRIVAGEIPAAVVREDDETLAFRDLDPRAPLHVLVIPKRHIASADDAALEDAPLLGRLITAAADIARAEGVVAGGYRLVLNTGSDAGQSVPHIHLHLLAGRALHWPPG